MITWIRRNEFPGLQTPSHVIEIPNFIQFAILVALDRHVYLPWLGERFLNLFRRVRGRGGRKYFSLGKEGVRVEGLEEVDGLLEVGDHFLLRGVVGVATWLQGADAGSVLVPFVLPEVFVVALVVFPIGVHVAQEIGLAGGGDDGGDVVVFAARIAVLLVGAVAAIRPGELSETA